MINKEKFKERLGSIGDKIFIIGFIVAFLNQFEVNPFFGFLIVLFGMVLIYFSIKE